MTGSRTRVLICLLLVTLLQVSQQLSANHVDMMARANRLLQGASSKIEIKESPNVKKYCDDSGVKKDEISITLEQRNQKREETPKRYAGIVVAFDAAIAGGSSSEVSNGMAGTGAGFSLVIAILSLLSLIFLFFWSICECCCDKTCCVDKQKHHQGRGWFRWCCFIGAIALGVISVAMTIAWAALVGKFTGKAKEVKCSFTILHNDLVYGTKITDDSKFIGVEGIDTLFGQLITLLDAIDGPSGIKSNAQTIKSRNIGQATTDLNTQYGTFKNNFDANTYTYKGTKDTAVTVVSGFGLLVKGGIETEAFAKEIETLTEVGKAVDEAATTIADYDTSGIQNSKNDLQNTRSTLKDTLRKPLDDAYNTLVESSTDYVGEVKKAGTGLMATAIVVIIVFTIVYFLILYMNIKDRWHKAKCITKIIMLLQLVMALLISIMSVVGVVVSISFAWICNGLDGMITVQNFMSTNFKGLKVDKQFIDISNTCIYKDGDGDLFKALGMDLSTITNVNKMTDGLVSYSNFKANLTAQSTPWVGGEIDSQISKGISYDLDIRGQPEAQDITSGITNFNYFKCSSDIMRFDDKDCPSGYTLSTTGDGSTTSLGSNYCMIGGGLPSHKYAGRYSGAVTCTNGSKVDAQTALFNTIDSMLASDTKLASLKTDYQSGFYTKELDVFTKMKASINDLDAIVDKIKDTVDSLSELGGSINKLVDCRVMQKEIIMFENVICFRIAEDYYQQTNVGVALGFFLFLYSWFMCCTIRLTNKKEEKVGEQYEQPQQQPAYENQEDKAYDHYQ